ncbi:MAG TPA: universal stress protein [Phycisphaerales bacterium]|jgi:nucleotide-binding universal stress UspA family protein|nr:universal stress protein [Phycisphaerales bacterium]
MPTISRILLPTAFSSLSRRAAEYVRLLLPLLDVRVHMVHVTPSTPVAMDPIVPGATGGVVAPPVDELLADSRRRLDSFAQENFPEYLDRITLASAFGDVADELLKYIRANQIDLVVMGTHADGMLKRIVWGSVGREVLEGAACPVLLVPVRGVSRL